MQHKASVCMCSLAWFGVQAHVMAPSSMEVSIAPAQMQLWPAANMQSCKNSLSISASVHECRLLINAAHLYWQSAKKGVIFSYKKQ